MSVRVVSAAEAAALDATAIAGGVPSRDLMRAAGRAAAELLLARYPLEAERGVAIFAGPGNNGGDAWVVAGHLARRGVRVRVAEAAAPATADAIAEREDASALLAHAPPDGTEGVIVDGLLGTGARGAPRGAIAAAIERIDVRHTSGRAAGAAPRVVSLDVPSGLDATTGLTAGVAVRADLTVSLGSLKRGLLVDRERAGAIAVVDIGLGAEPVTPGTPMLVDATVARRMVPRIAADAHKGVRRRLAVVGGAFGMAGASVLAARGALRSGIGMVKLCVAHESVSAVQALEPAAMAVAWPETERELGDLTEWAHVLVIGPGLGVYDRAHALVLRVLGAWRGPVVIDADALRVFDGRLDALRSLASGRAVVLTPHAVECARLAGRASDDVLARRFELPAELARATGATILLKGVPTVISDGDSTFVSASGTPVLATGGSGDVLGGIVATLLAQAGGGAGVAASAAATAAWVHGRAAEIAGAGQVRGVVLADVIDALRVAWRFDDAAPEPPILAELPRVSEYAMMDRHA